MSDFFLGTDTVTRVRAPLVRSARDNSESRDWTAATQTAIPNAMVEPFLPSNRLLVEDSRGREFQQEPVRVYLPAGADVVFTDRLLWQGKTYDVVTDPAAWTDFDGVTTFWTLVMRLRVG